MITFKSRCEAIKQADKITRTAKSIYPHQSTSRTQVVISDILPRLFNNEQLRHKLCALKLRKEIENSNLIDMSLNGLDYYRSIIDKLKLKQSGNCYEEALLAQIIGKINGLKNIYIANIFFNRNKSGAESKLRHVVAIVTDKLLSKEEYGYKFRNKEAIIIDPWLGITEFAGAYFDKLRNDFQHIFSPVISNETLIPKSVIKTKNVEEYNKIRKQRFKSGFSFDIAERNLEDESYVSALKKEYPELIFKK